MEDLKIVVDGKEYNVKVEELDNKLRVHFDGEVFEVETKSAIQEQLTEEIREKEVEGGKSIIRAPLPGIVFSVDVKLNEKVKKGEKLFTLMAMKMENEIVSPIIGTVKEIRVKKNESVNKGDILAVIEQII